MWLRAVTISGILLSVLVLPPAFPAQGVVRRVWQIGTFDRSPLEFSPVEHKNVRFEVGKSDPKEDWPVNQTPGHPYSIVFPLQSLAGVYTLRISALIVQPRVPVLSINVNGHKGRFYLQPRLSYFPGDAESAYHANHAQSIVRVTIPPSFLKQGENVIEIACNNDPPSAEDQESSSGIAYDALSLEQNQSDRYRADNVVVEATPTVFYHRTNTRLMELVDLLVRSNRPFPHETAELTFQGKKYVANLGGREEFGDQRATFEIPEWNGTLKGRVRVRGMSRQPFDVSLTPARKWTVFVVPHTHLDIGFTDFQGKVAEIQPRILTQAADLIKQHPDFRFSVDGSWNVQQFLDTRSSAKQTEVLDLIRAGKIGMPAQYCNLLTGYASLETLYRSLYESKALATQFDLPFEYANITDVPTYSGSYPSILASSGIKYWVAAANNYRAPLLYYEHWNEKSPFWWEGPDGKRVLFWYSWAYLQTQTVFGLPPELDAIRESLPIFLQAYTRPSYKPDAALMYGTQVENTDLDVKTATFASEWNKRYAYPTLRYATFPDFFHYIEARYAKDLPVFKGDGGGYWEDGIGSDAYFAAEDRRNQSRVLSAEILSTATHSVNPDLNPPQGLFADIWRNIILFAEHTWLSYNSITQPSHDESVGQLRVKDNRANRASLEIENIMNRSLSQLADLIHVPANTLVIFNSLNWPRSQLVETDLARNAQLQDLSTHQDVPFEIVSEKENFLRVRFLANNVPAVGYKCFSITPRWGARAAPEHSYEEAIENSFYRIRLDVPTGSVASIYDKQLHREIVDANSPYKMGQYLYVTGGDAKPAGDSWLTVLAYGGTRMNKSFLTLPPGRLTIHSALGSKLLGVDHLPWGDLIRMSSADTNTPYIETQILVYKETKKIEFCFRVRKTETTAKEGIYFAFPIGISKPAFTYSTQQGWVDPARNLMKGGSLEWFDIQQWMAVRDDSLVVGIVPVDTPLASFGDIFRGKWPGDFRPTNGSIFSYVMNNYWDTNYRASQGGDFVFRYALTSDSQLNGNALTRLAWEEMRPLEANLVTEQDKAGNPQRPLPETGKSFLEINGKDIALITWKAAEDGQGSILRLAEIAGTPSEATIKFPDQKLTSAYLCSGVEDKQRNLPIVPEGEVRLSFHPFEVLTLRVEGK